MLQQGLPFELVTTIQEGTQEYGDEDSEVQQVPRCPALRMHDGTEKAGAHMGRFPPEVALAGITTDAGTAEASVPEDLVKVLWHITNVCGGIEFVNGAVRRLFIAAAMRDWALDGELEKLRDILQGDDARAVVNDTSPAGATALYQACQTGRTEIARCITS